MPEMEKKAGYLLVISLSITSMIGTGIFFGPAIAARYAGNASLFAWLLLALVTVYVGFLFAELASLYPGLGGVYGFAKKAYGRFFSFMIGWVTWLVGSITPTVIIIAAINYLFPGIPLNKLLLLAVGIIILLNLVALRGIEASTALLLLFTLIIIGVIGSFIGFGFTKINPDNYFPLFTSSPLMIFVALFYIMETFFGWESATFMGEETKNPEVVIPRSIIISSVVSAVLGFLMAFVMLGVAPWQTLIKFSVPVANVGAYLFGESAIRVFNVLLFVALIGSAAGGIISTPRLLVALARDKLFIEQLSAIHPKYKTPYKAIIFQTVISLIVLLIALGEYESLLSLLVPLALLMYIGVILTVPVLRKKNPVKRSFKAPFGSVGAVIISLFYLSVIVAWLFLEPKAVILFRNIVSFILFGIPIYLLLNIYYNPDLLVKTIGWTAPLMRFTEGFTLPKGIRRKIIGIFGGLKGKNVLEFGSGVGTLTKELAREVYPGVVYAVDLSRENLRIVEKRLRKEGIDNVRLFHDEHFISRVHPDIPEVDMVFSAGSLSYVQNIKSVLSDMNRLLPENGRVVFLEYVDYFWGLIPNAPWLDDPEMIRRLFRESGFSVRIKKQKGLFWSYLLIYGIKNDLDVPVI